MGIKLDNKFLKKGDKMSKEKIKEYIGGNTEIAVNLVDKILKDKRLNKNIRMEYSRMLIDNAKQSNSWVVASNSGWLTPATII